MDKREQSEFKTYIDKLNTIFVEQFTYYPDEDYVNINTDPQINQSVAMNNLEASFRDMQQHFSRLHTRL